MTHTVDAEWSLEAADGVTLVQVRVRNPTPVDRAVRVESRLDGDVLPPRTDGVVDPGWTDDGYVGAVPAGDERALGFAVRAEPERPPVDVGDEGRATDADRPTPTAVEAARRALRSPRPPRDAVPVPDVEAVPDDRTDAASGTAAAPGSSRDDGGVDADLPPDVADWLAAVEARVARAERLDAAGVREATAALAEAGGADGAAALDDRLDDDEARLRALAERAAALADRAATADVPAAALRRLA